MNGAEFRALRAGAGITRAAVARGVGVSWETVRRWELGLRREDIGSGAVEWLLAEIERGGGGSGGVRGICNAGGGEVGGAAGG